jgi:hypothetical protein
MKWTRHYDVMLTSIPRGCRREYRFGWQPRRLRCGA